MLRNRLYYSIKPLVPLPVRFAIRRWFAVRKRRRVDGAWPIMPGSELPPEGWPGWPEGKQFALVLTHDVEGNLGLGKCDRLIELEKSLGFRSSFNLIPEGEYKVSDALRADFHARGCEVGVHDLYHDGKLFLSEHEFSTNAVRINHYLREWGATGFRSGFMLHNLDWLHQLDVQYDASTFDTDPFEPQPQGRSTIFPFWVPGPADGVQGSEFDVQGSKFSSALNPQPSTLNHCPTPPLHHSTTPLRSGYVELPYTLPQDSTLFLLLKERHPDIWFQKLDWIARYGGMALVNAHPDYMRFEGEAASPHTYPADLYRQFLEYARQRYKDSFWQPLPRDLAAWYRPKPVSYGIPTSAGNGLDTADRSRHPAPGVLRGKHAAVILYSGYPSDARPRRELAALLDEGMSVDLICLREKADDAVAETRGALTVTRLPMQHERSGKIRYLAQYARFWLSSFWLVTIRSLRRRYDLVHVHNMPDVLVFSALVPRLIGAKIILDLHDPMPELYQTIFKLRQDCAMVRWLKRLEKWSIGFAHLVLTPNRAFRELFCARGGPASKIHIVMNTPDEKIFRPEPTPAVPAAGSPRKAEFRLVYHGLIAERQGVTTVVKALIKLTQVVPGIVLDVYGGRNAYMDEVNRLAAEARLDGKFRYHGKCMLDDIPAAIKEADLGIIPNSRTPFTEINFPTRIFEYLCMGKPVIVPDTKGIRDYFNETQIIFFEPDSVDDLARAILWVYEHPQETQEILVRGQQIYEQNRWGIHRRNFVSLVSSLLSPRCAGGRSGPPSLEVTRQPAGSKREAEALQTGD